MSEYGYTYLITWQFETVCTVVMLIIGPSTLSALLKHSYEKGTLVHWRLIVSTALMSGMYVLQLIWLVH
jgi:hypothetical protein